MPQRLLGGKQQLIAEVAADAVERELICRHDDERSVLKTKRLAAAKPQFHAFLSYLAGNCLTQPRHDIHFILGHFLRTLRAHRDRRLLAWSFSPSAASRYPADNSQHENEVQPRASV